MGLQPFVSSYCYICVLILVYICVLTLLYMCPYTDVFVVLFEVWDDDLSGEGVYEGVGSLLLGSAVLSGNLLAAPARGREAAVWLPLMVTEWGKHPYVSSYCYICVRMCQFTAIYVSLCVSLQLSK
jgi:hypothetical protein